MGQQLVPVKRPTTDGLHPVVYGAMVALTAWFVLSVWALFSGGYASLNDLVITVFFVMAVGIPGAIWLAWRRHRTEEEKRAVSPQFGRWLAGEFANWTGSQKASQAAIEILLPIAAVAIGITVFGLVFRIVALTVA
jgi:hypothetical protein